MDPRFGRIGKQEIRDTGPLTSKRMETVDEEFLARTKQFITKAANAQKPFFVWFAPSRMHIYTHLKPASRKLAKPYSSEMDIYGSGMIEHDGHVGQLLSLPDQLKLSRNTIVIYTTDNGAMSAWWPDGGATPFRGEKATTWEGGVRVPMLVRWPARIAAGRVSNGVQEHQDLFTTLAAAAGVSDVRSQLRQSDNVYIDGVNNLDHWTKGTPSERNIVYYYNERELTAIRIGNWKSHFKTRDGFFDTNKPSALVFNLRMDPFESHDGQKNNDIAMKLGIAWGGQIQDALREHQESLKQFPPRQVGGSLRPGGQ